MYNDLISNGKNYSVLFVEDEDAFSAIVKELLENFFKNLYLAKDGLEGLELYKKYSPSIVITDITMPKMDGITMAEKIRELDSEQKIVIISAHGDSTRLIYAIDIGVDYFLTKPLDSNLLLKKLDLLVSQLYEIERKKRHEELERTLINQSKMAAMGEMISIIAHQLKQPLTVIPLYFGSFMSELESKDCDCHVVASKFEDNVIEQLEYINSTITLFSNYLKPTSTKSKFSLIKSINETTRILSFKLRRYDIELIEKYQSDKLIVYGYQKELNQVLINIVSNGMDALIENREKNRRVSITIRVEEEYGVIEIEDNGGGVDAKVKSRIFEPYVSTKGKNGTGVGLYLAKKIITESFCGKILLEDGEEGAKFIIKLPLIKEDLEL